jgi:hypothetical protein
VRAAQNLQAYGVQKRYPMVVRCCLGLFIYYITVFQTAQAFLLNFYYSRNEFVEIKHSGYCKLGKGNGRSFP